MSIPNKERLQKVGLIAVTIIIIFMYVFKWISPIVPFSVSGESMYPTYNSSDFIWIDKTVYKDNTPQKGDVVVINIDWATNYIKRVVATPGDTIQIKDGVVILNGKALNESYLNEDYIQNPGMFSDEYQVKDNEYVCLGDNRNNSYDSRDMGPVSIEQIVGKVKTK